MNFVKNMYDKMGKHVDSPAAIWWLSFFFFIEASIFFIPVDPLLILFCIQNNKKSFFFATIATIFSVIGGIFGYIIGSFMWDSIGTKIVTWIIGMDNFNKAVAKYTLYQNWAVLIAGFTPIPYKAVTISAGFCKLPIAPFIIYSIIARGARFFLLAGSIKIWGNYIKIFIEKYFNYLAIAFTLLIIISFKVLMK
jgi:membrane protein YqaA with SNARE-associated domain